MPFLYNLWKIVQRQGGTTGDGAWNTTGTSNTDVSGKGVLVQVGAANDTGSGKTVTFPTAYTQTPLVFVSSISAGSQNSWTRVSSISTTQFTAQMLISNAAGVTNENFAWMAVGQ